MSTTIDSFFLHNDGIRIKAIRVVALRQRQLMTRKAISSLRKLHFQSFDFLRQIRALITLNDAHPIVSNLKLKYQYGTVVHSRTVLGS